MRLEEHRRRQQRRAMGMREGREERGGHEPRDAEDERSDELPPEQQHEGEHPHERERLVAQRRGQRREPRQNEEPRRGLPPPRGDPRAQEQDGDPRVGHVLHPEHDHGRQRSGDGDQRGRPHRRAPPHVHQQRPRRREVQQDGRDAVVPHDPLEGRQHPGPDDRRRGRAERFAGDPVDAVLGEVLGDRQVQEGIVERKDDLPVARHDARQHDHDDRSDGGPDGERALDHRPRL
jgi:hypothetical protein